MTNKELYAKASEAIQGDDSSGLVRAARNAWCMGYEKALEDMGVKIEKPEVSDEERELCEILGITHADLEQLFPEFGEENRDIYEQLMKLGQ